MVSKGETTKEYALELDLLGRDEVRERPDNRKTYSDSRFIQELLEKTKCRATNMR